MLLYFILCLAAVLVVRAYRRTPGKHPPGPPSIPLFGNAYQLNGPSRWEYLASLTPIHGDVLYFSNPVLGLSILALNSYEAAHDLLVQRAPIYSDRPHSTMAELMDIHGLGTARYGPRWRLGRKLFHQHIGKNAIRDYSSAFEEESRMLVHRLHQKPETFVDQICLAITRIILGVTYNYRSVQSTSDPVVTRVEQAVSHIVQSILPGRFLINVIPALKHLPSWLPFLGDKKLAIAWRKEIHETFSQPFQYVKDQRAAGTAGPSFALSLLEGKDTDDDDIMTWQCASMYAGGAETTSTMLRWFFFAMVRYPEAQHAAQAEIDQVIGDRLPDLNDRDCLPYVEALIKELLRCFVIAPTALPHRLMEDDHYKGYFIPKGTIVLPNSWSISRNEEMYPNPAEFRPERFLEPSTKSGEFPMDPHKYVFGFGRRLCPGIDFADASLFLNIATILSTTSIVAPSGTKGNTIALPLSPISRKPLPFPCEILPRSTAAACLVEEYVSASPNFHPLHV